MINNILLLSFPALMIAAAISDISTLRVSNVLVFSLLAAFFMSAYRVNMSSEDMLMSALVFSCCLAVGFIAFTQKWIGGADGKLLAIMGLWLGAEAILPALLVVAFIAGGMAALIVSAGKYVTRPLPTFLANIIETRTIPYAAALSCGSILFYSESRIWAAFYR